MKDVVVVGAGIVGAAIAHALAERGLHVTVLERGVPAGEASRAAAGMLAPGSEADEPGAFLDLALHSLRLWPDLAARVEDQGGGTCRLVRSGVLRACADDADLRSVGERVAWQRTLGIAAEILDADGVHAAEPAAAPMAGGVLYPDEAHVHSPSAALALLAAATRLGAEVRSGVEVEGPTPGGGVRLRGGETVAAGTVVLAAGAWTGALAGRFGAPLPVTPVRGQLAVLSGVPSPPRRIVFAGRRGYVVAKQDGTVLVGATEDEAGFDSRPDPAATERLLEAGRRLVPGVAAATQVVAWAGLRPRAPGGLPLMGRLGDATGPAAVLVATGHHRNGVLLAPATAAGMAALVIDGAAPAGWEAFDPAVGVAQNATGRAP